MFYGCNVSCNQLPTSSNGDWSALIQRFSPHSYSIIYKRKEEGRFLPDFRSRLEVGVSSPKMMKRVIGGMPNKCPERYRHRTPLYHLERLKAPVLIIHGERDENVSIEHAWRLERRLKQLGKPVTAWYFPEFTHYFPPQANRETVQRLTEWMKQQPTM